MSIILFMAPFALLMGLGFVALFIWCTRSGQYDDLETPAVRILLDEVNSKTRSPNEHDKSNQ